MRFELLPKADADLLDQYLYLREHASEEVADRFLLASEQAIAALISNPSIGTPCQATAVALSGLRSWPFRGFPSVRAYYVQRANLLEIVRILHGKRDLETLLDDEDQ